MVVSYQYDFFLRKKSFSCQLKRVSVVDTVKVTATK